MSKSPELDLCVGSDTPGGASGDAHPPEVRGEVKSEYACGIYGDLPFAVEFPGVRPSEELSFFVAHRDASPESEVEGKGSEESPLWVYGECPYTALVDMCVDSGVWQVVGVREDDGEEFSAVNTQGSSF